MIEVNVDIGRNRATFDALTSRALRLSENPEHDDQSLRMVQAAADFAWYNPTGLFASEALEGICRSVGRRLQPAPARSAARDGRRRFLHVFSEAHHSAGGHVRFPWRWMAMEPQSVHSVAITNQPSHEGPSPVLVANAERTGGSVKVISDEHRSFVGRAQRLRTLAADADVVVLHVHPYDAVVTAALSTERGPHRIFINHADHVFWLGVSVADSVFSFRSSGASLAVDHRGVAPSRSAVLPLIVEAPERTLSKAQAKASLGIDPGATVLFTAAHGYKYAPIDQFSFLDMVRGVLERSPGTVLLTAGAGKDPSWAEAASELAGSLVDLGRVESTSVLEAAADIYLDPYPFTSCTSFLQAAAHGSPVVNFSPRGPEVAVLDSRDFADEGVILRSDRVEDYQTRLRELIRDPVLRSEVGREARSWVIENCTAPAWSRHLHGLLEAHLRSPRLTVLPAVPGRRVGLLDQMLLALHERGGMCRPVAHSLAMMGCAAGALAGR